MCKNVPWDWGVGESFVSREALVQNQYIVLWRPLLAAVLWELQKPGVYVVHTLWILKNIFFSPREVNLGFPASTNPSLDNGIYAGVDLGEGMPPRVPESYWLPCGGQNLLQIIMG